MAFKTFRDFEGWLKAKDPGGVNKLREALATGPMTGPRAAINGQRVGGRIRPAVGCRLHHDCAGRGRALNHRDGEGGRDCGRVLQ